MEQSKLKSIQCPTIFLYTTGLVFFLVTLSIKWVDSRAQIPVTAQKTLPRLPNSSVNSGVDLIFPCSPMGLNLLRNGFWLHGLCGCGVHSGLLYLGVAYLSLETWLKFSCFFRRLCKILEGNTSPAKVVVLSRLQRIFIGSQISNMASSLPETRRSSSDIGGEVSSSEENTTYGFVDNEGDQELGMISDELLSNSDSVDQITDDSAQLESVSESPEWANQRPGERNIECHTISRDAASSAGYSNSQSDGSQASIRSTSFMACQSSGLMARQSLVCVTPDYARLHSGVYGETVNEPNSSVTAPLHKR
ncbi:hypothetical protein AKJ16_DCAP12730 [Drosera capensis]